MSPVRIPFDRSQSCVLPTGLRNFWAVMIVGLVMLGLQPSAQAMNADPCEGCACDEGMWLFTNLPKEILRKLYGFELEDEWAQKLMRSCVRFKGGGSGSFVSSNGLVLTNHHVAMESLRELSTPEQDLLANGFLATSMEQELKVPGMRLAQLLSIKDVTDKVKSVVTDDLTDAQARAKRSGVFSEICQAATADTGCVYRIVTLYGGKQYHLYEYKRYSDCLLYTSPSPRDRTRSRMPSSA